MGDDADIMVLRQSVLPVVFMATSATSDDSDSSLYETAKGIFSGAIWDTVEEQRVEVLNEYSNVSKEDYNKELARTVEEAEKYGHAMVPNGSYGDEVAEYIQEHAPDVDIERYGEPDEQMDRIHRAKGASSEVSYSEKKEMFPNYKGPFSGVRTQERKDKNLRESRRGTPFAPINYISAAVRLGEDKDSFAVPGDYRSRDPPYADMDFVTTGDSDSTSVESDGGSSEYEAGDGSLGEDSTTPSGLGSTGESTSYEGDVEDEFMSTGFNEFAKVQTEDGETKYLKNGEETSQQAYAAASGSRAPDKTSEDSPTVSEDTGESGREFVLDEFYTSGGKEWRKEKDEAGRVQVYENGVPRIDYGEDEDVVEKQKESAMNAFNAASQHSMPEYTDDEREEAYTSAGKEWVRERDEDGNIQVYENGVPKIDYSEDDEIIVEQKERAEKAFRTAKSQHAMPEYTDTGEHSESEMGEEGEEYDGGVLDALKETVSGYIGKGKSAVEKRQVKAEIREDYEDRDGEKGVGARLGKLQRKKKHRGLSEQEQEELEELHQRRFELKEELQNVDEEFRDSEDYVGKLRAGLENSYESVSEKVDEWNEPHPGRGPEGAKQYQQHRELITRLKALDENGESAVVVTDKTYEEEIEEVLANEGIDYTAKDAL